MIACATKIGYGSPNKEGSEKSHGAALGKDEVAKTRKNLKWNYKPFEIPKPVLKVWRRAGLRSKKLRLKWELNLKKSILKKDFTKSLLEKIMMQLKRFLLGKQVRRFWRYLRIIYLN
jgi:transketolase